MPPYTDGDMAVCFPTYPLRNGSLVVGKMHDGEVFVRILTIPATGKYRFTSDNPEYGPFERGKDELAWVYPVAVIQRNTL